VAFQIVLCHRRGRVAHQALHLLDLPTGFAKQRAAQAADLVEARRVVALDAGRFARVEECSRHLLGHDLRVVLPRCYALVRRARTIGQAASSRRSNVTSDRFFASRSHEMLLSAGAWKVLAGVLPEIRTIPVKRAESLSFDEMGQARFQELFDGVTEHIGRRHTHVMLNAIRAEFWDTATENRRAA